MLQRTNFLTFFSFWAKRNALCRSGPFLHSLRASGCILLGGSSRSPLALAAPRRSAPVLEEPVPRACPFVPPKGQGIIMASHSGTVWGGLLFRKEAQFFLHHGKGVSSPALSCASFSRKPSAHASCPPSPASPALAGPEGTGHVLCTFLSETQRQAAAGLNKTALDCRELRGDEGFGASRAFFSFSSAAPVVFSSASHAGCAFRDCRTPISFRLKEAALPLLPAGARSPVPKIDESSCSKVWRYIRSQS